MKNRFILFTLGLFLFSNFTFSQGTCGSYDGYLEDQIKKYPEFYNSLGVKNNQLNQERKSLLKNVSLKSQTGKKIIPVVVHVVHNLGAENVTDAQIRTAINVLNKNINGQSDNFLSRTPDVFAAVRGVANVEFRLATKDPLGEPTSGVNRIQSELTDVPEPRDQVKSLSYWSSNKYLNIWVVKSLPQDNGGVLLGYAQFPYDNNMATDGVVLISSQFANSESATLTHEVGHWLGLRHIWGDAICGNDGIEDTPPQRYSNGFGDNPGPLPSTNSFPYHVGFQGQGCIADSLNWAGEMFMNYMDYTNDQYVTMFSQGQVDEMLFTLTGDGSAEAPFGYREYLWQEQNLISTGTTDGAVSPVCNQKADFRENASHYSICLGEEVWLKSNKSMFGNTITDVLWELGDGNTSQVNDNVLHTYATPGTYDVTLTINYDEITQTRVDQLSDLPNTPLPTSIDTIISDVIIQASSQQGLYDIAINDLNTATVNNITEIFIDSLGVYYGLENTSYFRGIAQKTTYVANYINQCVTQTKKEDFIYVGSNSSNNSAGAYQYTFNSEADLNSDWVRAESQNQGGDWNFSQQEQSRWEWVSGVASDGSSCIMMDRDNLSVASPSNQIISQSYNLSGLNTPAIRFSYSGAAINTSPSNVLNVTYSNDCGEIWRPLGSLDAVEAANAGLYTSDFTPTIDQWNTRIMKHSALKDDNIRFRFEFVTNGSGNNFYLDDIRIGEENDLLISNVNPLYNILIHPNPIKGGFPTNITIYDLADKHVEIKLVNVLGIEVLNIFKGKLITNEHLIENINTSFLKNGIYFIKVIDFENNKSLAVDKLIKRN